MNNLRIPKTPAQAWREMEGQEKAYTVGLALRAVWELTKPLLIWSAFILAVGVWAVSYVVFRGVFPKK